VHNIQRKILHKLMFATSLGYAQMRPEGVESNHFAYHLDQLLHAGLIAKQDRKYFLTPEGLALADRVSHDNMLVRTQPQIVTAAHITNAAGQTLLFKHTFQPYLGLSGFPQGRLHYDEHVAEAAARELQEKTGLAGIKLKHRGIAYIEATKEETSIGKLLLHVFSGSMWGDASALKPEQCMPGFIAIQELLSAHKGFFFAELSETLAAIQD
jgi:ADP-ribose pyrophosphatase YjhB (NUDIX family)